VCARVNQGRRFTDVANSSLFNNITCHHSRAILVVADKTDHAQEPGGKSLAVAESRTSGRPAYP